MEMTMKHAPEVASDSSWLANLEPSDSAPVRTTQLSPAAQEAHERHKQHITELLLRFGCELPENK